MNMDFQILDWDSNFFGFKVAKVLTNSKNLVSLKEIYNNLFANNVRLAYWQVEPDSYVFQKFASENNGKLVDLKTIYSIKIDEENVIDISNPNLNIYKENTCSPELINLSIQCGIYSRYNVDDDIPKNKMKELYELWIKNSVDKTMADDTIVYSLDNKIVGFVTVYIKNEIGYIGLIGVDENYRGRGIGKSLIEESKRYFFKKNIINIEVVTQGNNQSACKLYESADFRIKNQNEFYHFWL
jgi:dTDP-4-amino-4,6-dideoxy-D-galactose acyltransferase